ncbi:MAG: tripartite tricarboxylate transporter TctB family protein [Candidatus Fimivivens sp.]|nr:tripartite tricarboxylate transporter TctB family protein [Candidatus Fimivivens sp.]
MTNKQRDILCSVLFLVFGAFVFVQALPIKPVMGKDIGSGFMPKIIGASIIVIAAVKLVLTLISKASAAKASTDDDLKGGLWTIAALLAYVLLFDRLGFILSTALYLFVQILVLSNEQNRNLKLFVAISVVTPVAIYALFVYVIKMPLPAGLLNF